MQVGGGYIITTWQDKHIRINEEALALQAGGWTSADKAEMMETYNFDEEHAENIAAALADLEEEA